MTNAKMLEALSRAEQVLRDAGESEIYTDRSIIWICGKHDPFRVGDLRQLVAALRATKDREAGR